MAIVKRVYIIKDRISAENFSTYLSNKYGPWRFRDGDSTGSSWSGWVYQRSWIYEVYDEQVNEQTLTWLILKYNIVETYVGVIV
jgi:hypothetical protein